MEQLITIEDLMQKSFPPQKWQVDKLIPEAAITIFSGAPASCKTWITLHTAISVASGEPLFKEFATKQSGVLIIDEENSQRLVQERLFMLGALADLPIYFSPQPGFVLSNETVAETLIECETRDIKVIIIDSLVRIHASDENSSGEMAAVFKQLRKFTAQDITLILTHHNRKPGVNAESGLNAMRGSSDIPASIDSHIAISRRKDSLVVHQTKNRYAPELEKFEVQVSADDNSFRLIYEGEVNISDKKRQMLKDTILKQLSAAQQPIQKELLASLKQLGEKINEHKLRELLEELIEEGLVTETQGVGRNKHYGLQTGAENE